MELTKIQQEGLIEELGESTLDNLILLYEKSSVYREGSYSDKLIKAKILFLKGLKEPIQETLEEAAERHDSDRDSFIAGAKWQSERMFSKEEVNEIISEAWLSCEDNEGETFTNANHRILQKFKKK